MPHSHVFSSEINPRKRKFIEHNFASASSRGMCTVFPDMLRRDPQTMPRCDLYVCGFPCRYLDKVWSRLSRLRWYEVLTVRINPKDLGEPVTRDRLFFILVRLDVARPNLEELVDKLLRAGLATERCGLSSRLLPRGSRLLEPRCHRGARSGVGAFAPPQGSLVASIGPQPNQRQQTAYFAACTRALDRVGCAEAATHGGRTIPFQASRR